MPILQDTLGTALMLEGDLIEQNGGDFHTNNMLVSAQGAVLMFAFGAGVPLVATALSCLAQHRLIGALLGGNPPWNVAQIAPNAARLNPLNGMRRIFGSSGAGSGEQGADSTSESGMWPTRMLSELLKSAALHVSAIAVLCWRSQQYRQPVDAIETLCATLSHELSAIFCAIIGFWAAIGIADVLLERMLHEKRLRMDIAELRKELRQSEGNPELRALRRQLHQSLLHHELVQGVRKARILVVNGDRGL